MTSHVLLMSDYANWPLWLMGGTSPEDWPQLTPALIDALNEWETYWENHFSWDVGWDVGKRDWYAQRGEQLQQVVQRELGPHYVVELRILG